MTSSNLKSDIGLTIVGHALASAFDHAGETFGFVFDAQLLIFGEFLHQVLLSVVHHGRAGDR